MRVRALVLFVFALFAVVAPARADLVAEVATVAYSPGSKTWDFITASTGGRIRMTTSAVAKQLTKLKATGLSHGCTITYDNDSKVEALNGNFYSVFKVSKCD